ncbi:3-deoxy-7-phosphoheptulonate synthase [Selenihalanaerobacter shriftii]|uniref:3-deoxy-D-arabinoheptulosonate-7-phosphate synthase n=1 Tax=Selenihalanaerobacter shriftii TaxID=142842 RepID=A0A1T4KMK8_9FIRM|nr:3-deoxy-7-phosphoheptulonate synthase [Selenihalanaerobacter shriftii]SJZ43635.1 3-deoxy-D-arabinoheptulosonate-7-phosphate synthase [Selenihalanaerobacter shriftii]
MKKIKNIKHVTAKAENGTCKKTEIKIGDITVGKDFLVIAGPCSVESEEQIMTVAKAVKDAGVNMLRGSVYKLGTSPYSFQGLRKVELQYLSKAGMETRLPIITEVLDPRDIYLISEYADAFQIRANNMQNYSLLVEVGKVKKPVLLKRGMNATIKEWLNCAEYIMNAGNPNVILCECGVQTTDTYTRTPLNLSAVTVAKRLTHLPVIVDPSHATDCVELIRPMTLSSIMAGCDGVIIEVHPSTCDAFSDIEQKLTPDQFKDLMGDIRETLTFRDNLNEHYKKKN